MEMFELFVVLSLIGWCSSEGATPCPPLAKLDILPGQGWDSLRNIEMGQIIAVTYNECRMTLDGKYLLPDHMFTIPLRDSNVQLYSEIIYHWSHYSSITSRSMGIIAGGKALFASGSFSKEYQNTKQHQVNDKSITTRIYAEYTLYKVGIQAPTVNLTPELKSLFYDSINALKKKNIEKSYLILELIIRDYGTHVVMHNDAGAIIVKEDFINRQYAESLEQEGVDIKAVAATSFYNIFNFGASYEKKQTETVMEGYSNITTSSSVSTMGGAWFRPNSTVDEWINTINNNLASIDKSGDPLYFLIKPETFPDVALETLGTLRNNLMEVINNYYFYNGHKGCMKVDAPNFDFNANVEGVCEENLNNFTLGGIYQTCTVQSQDINFVGDWCAQYKMNTINVLSGDYNCPIPYTSVLLKSGSLPFENSKCIEKCSGWWLWKRCHTECSTISSTMNYSAYWCAATANVSANHGMMFGGLYSSKIVNPITHDYNCPATFAAFKILQDLYICLGDTYDLGIEYSIDFGGFFSCQNGNPLYDLKFLHSKLTTKLRNELELLKACPNGYTQHVAVDDLDCRIHYCVLADSFRAYGEMPIVLPPFRNFTGLFVAEKTVEPSDVPRSGIGFEGIFIGFLAAFVLSGMIVLLIVLYRRWRNIRIAPYDHAIDDGSNDTLIQNETEDA